MTRHVVEFDLLPIADGVWLRKWLAHDAESLAEACDDPEIARWLRLPSPYTLDTAHAYLRSVDDWWRTGEAYSVAIADDTSILGAISIRPRRDQPSIGYWLAKSARGRGLAMRAVDAVARWAAETFDLADVWIFAHPANAGSCRVALRAGFSEQAERVVFPDGKPRAVFRRSMGEAGEEVPAWRHGPQPPGT
jgi:RimJ/RimL family protein N-acetyltransferase